MKKLKEALMRKPRSKAERLTHDGLIPNVSTVLIWNAEVHWIGRDADYFVNIFLYTPLRETVSPKSLVTYNLSCL